MLLSVLFIFGTVTAYITSQYTQSPGNTSEIMSKVGKRSKLSHLCGSTLGYLVYVFPFVSSLHEAQDSHTPWAFIAERTASYGVCIGPQLILSWQNWNIWYHIADAATTVWPMLHTWSTILCHTELQYSHHGLTVIYFFFFHCTVSKVKACEERTAQLFLQDIFASFFHHWMEGC